MRRTATRIGFTVAVVLGLVISGIGVTVVNAQGAPGALQAILEALARLQSSITGVQRSVDALATVGNVMFTPPVIAESGILDCLHINVANVDRHVHTQLINANTGAVEAEGAGSIATPPGRSRGVGVFVPGAFSGTGYCKFTVLDGTNEDIRGNLALTPNSGGDETTSVSVEAH